jgi:hypothetical protein
MAGSLHCRNEKGQWWLTPSINSYFSLYSQVFYGVHNMRSIDDTWAPNIFTKNESSFRELHYNMDSIYRKLRSECVGAEKYSAEPFTIGDENKLWSLGVMGTPLQTRCEQYSTTYTIAKVFVYGVVTCTGIWSYLSLEEQKRLHLYTENSSKNRQGGISQLTLKNKCVEIVENKEAEDRCHCKLLDAYISKLPEEAKTKDLFYARPLEEVKSDSTKPWYYCAPISCNKLSKMVSEMCTM